MVGAADDEVGRHLHATMHVEIGVAARRTGIVGEEVDECKIAVMEEAQA